MKTIFFGIGLLLCLVSCGPTTKKLMKSKERLTETKLEQSDILHKKEIDSIRSVYQDKIDRLESEKREQEYTGIEFHQPPPCPATVLIDSACNADSLVKVIKQLQAEVESQQNEVEFYADGSFKAKGQISSIKREKDKSEKLVQQKQETIDSLFRLRKSDSLSTIDIKQDSLTRQTEFSNKDIKRGMPGWYWLLLGAVFVAGSLFWAKFGKRILGFLRYHNIIKPPST